MAGITLEQAEARLQQYLDAEERVLTKQSYNISGRTLTYANLGEIREGIKLWDDRCRQLALRSRGQRRVVVVRP